jgi:mannose-1-phosphate guanylyltransferase / phosphomannomutase
MKAMIMAAGLGTRLLPLTRFISKPMVPVLDRPLMEHLLLLLVRHGFTDLAANLHYQPFDLPQRFDDGAAVGVSLRYEFELELSGTAGGTGLFRDFLSDGTFLVMSGDALTDVDLTSLVAHHRASGCVATIAVKRVADPSRYGVVVTGERDRVTAFQEKPRPEEARSNLCSCGIYVLEPQIFDYIPPGRFVDYAVDVFPALLADGVPLGTWNLNSYWSDVGDLDAYRHANFDALAGRAGVASDCALLRPGIWAGDGAHVAPSAVLAPPVLLGRGCRVESGASVIGPVALGSGCSVGSDAVVERSVLWRRCSIGAGAFVDGAILGASVTVGEGAGVGHGAVVAGGCLISDGTAVPPDARLEPGTIVRADEGAC